MSGNQHGECSFDSDVVHDRDLWLREPETVKTWIHQEWSTFKDTREHHMETSSARGREKSWRKTQGGQTPVGLDTRRSILKPRPVGSCNRFGHFGKEKSIYSTLNGKQNRQNI